MTGLAPYTVPDAVAQLAAGRVFDLSHSWFQGMPVAPVHPPYTFSLVRRHGDVPRDDGVSTANEIVVLCGHAGTHLDALGHASRDGRMAGGLDAAEVQTGGRGLTQLGVESVAPIVCQALLLDVAATLGVECLPAGYEITPDDLEAAERRAGARLGPGQAALVRTGWARHWPDGERFISAEAGTPGPGPAAADWLVERGVRVTGSDTLVYEAVQPGRNVRPVHGRLLVDAGVYIMEALNLEELARSGPPAFLLVVSPLKLVGATGSPVRPLALCPPSAANGAEA